MALRFDVHRIDKSDRTPQGYLRTKAAVTRVGVFTYVRGDGSVVREFRPPEEVFKESHLDSIKGIPVTLQHPDEMLDAENTEKHQIGYTGENIEKKDDVFVVAPLTITKKAAIKKIDGGTRELSLGYHCDVEETPGEWQGEKYDAVQRNIICNHLSVVDRARGGRSLRIDSEDAVLGVKEEDGSVHSALALDTTPPGGNMEKVIIGGKEYEVSSAVATALKAHNDALDAKVATATKEATDAKAQVTTEKSRADGLQGKVDMLEGQLKERKDATVDEKVIQERVDSRLKIQAVATKVVKDAKFDGKSDLDIMKEVILSKNKDLKLDGKSNEYIQAAFDIVAEDVARNDKAADDFGSGFRNSGAGNRQDSGAFATEDEVAAARKRQREDAEKACSQSTTVTKK